MKSKRSPEKRGVKESQSLFLKRLKKWKKLDSLFRTT